MRLAEFGSAPVTDPKSDAMPTIVKKLSPCPCYQLPIGCLEDAWARLRDHESSRHHFQRSIAVDFDYLTRRMTEERQRAADADLPAAREAHLELAEHYRRQIERLGAGEDQGPIAAAG